MRAIFNRVGIVVVLTVLALTGVSVWMLRYQGANAVDWNKIGWGQVSFDAYGIPTITAKDWDQLIKLQGYVHASERLFQMDLIRRSASGRLSQLFGEKSKEHDRRRLQEDWYGSAALSAQTLSKKEAHFCKLYAEGVNAFILQNKRAWGLEYTILNAKPEPWTCTDSILVSLYMADFLTASADVELNQAKWREKLSEEWQAFLFPRTHPWAKPYFGTPDPRGAALPPIWQYLPQKSLQKSKAGVRLFEDLKMEGSNAWVWSNGAKTFLATDPHLRQVVPQIWYANRLRINDQEWVVGASLAGLPGVIIGSNPNYAWSFTSLNDDVDDYLIETVSEDGNQYIAFEQNGRPQWRRIVKKKLVLKIKGKDSINVEAMFTHRGPLRRFEQNGKVQYLSRQWLALQKGALYIPVLSINQGKTWSDFNKNIDLMLSPSMVAIFADTKGNIGFRATGGELFRKVSGNIPQPALQGEWLKPADATKRRRMFLANDGKQKPRFLVNANGQIWEDGTYQRWMSEDRRERIETMLSQATDIDQHTMEIMQLDTKSRFAKELLNWMIKGLPENKFQAYTTRWQKWDGDIKSDEEAFTEATLLETELADILLDQVRTHFYDGAKLPKYETFLRRAWLLRVISSPNGPKVFGLDAQELTNELMVRLEKQKAHRDGFPTHSVLNSWAAQHPFYGNIPLIGWLFRVRSYPQFGSAYVVRSERPAYGSSTRMVWNITNPVDSTWIFPVGQSGHIGSKHYRDLQSIWSDGQTRIGVFPEDQVYKTAL